MYTLTAPMNGDRLERNICESSMIIPKRETGIARGNTFARQLLD